MESSFPRCFQPLTRKSGGHCLVAPRNGFAAAKLFVEEGAYVFITGRRQKKLDGAAKAIGTKLPASRETSPSWLALIGSTKPSMRKGGKWHRLGSISLRFWQCRAAIAAFECCNPPL